MISFECFAEAYDNYSSLPAVNRDKWECLLDILNANEWGAYEYLDWVFREYRKPMVPSLLCSDSVMESFRAFRESRIESSRFASEWALEQVASRLDLGMSVKDILSDREINSDSLLMYLIAKSAGLSEEADKLHEAALYDIRIKPELRDMYGSKFMRRCFP